MWHLQHKKVPKRVALWLKIITICLIFHGTVIWWVFHVHQSADSLYILSIQKKHDYSTPIMFYTPLPQPTIPIAPAVKKNIPIKPTEKAKIATTIAPLEKKAVPSSVPEKKKEPIIEDKKNEPAKKLPAIKKVPEAAQKSPLPAETQQPESHIKAQDSTFSHNYREVEAWRRGAQLQKELVHQWHPPIGISADCSCDISFFVTPQGIVEKITMTKSSGVVMFDISARQALLSTKMPPWTHGKPLIITFKQ
jgi:outer membrane biosynthesis protein TonB